MTQAGDTVCPECGATASATPAGIPPMVAHEPWCGQSTQRWHESIEDAIGVPRRSDEADPTQVSSSNATNHETNHPRR